MYFLIHCYFLFYYLNNTEQMVQRRTPCPKSNFSFRFNVIVLVLKSGFYYFLYSANRTRHCYTSIVIAIIGSFFVYRCNTGFSLRRSLLLMQFGKIFIRSLYNLPVPCFICSDGTFPGPVDFLVFSYLILSFKKIVFLSNFLV